MFPFATICSSRSYDAQSVVNQGRVGLHRPHEVGERGQRLVLHLDQARRFGRRGLGEGGHSRDDLALESHDVLREQGAVLHQPAEADIGQVVLRDHRDDTGRARGPSSCRCRRILACGMVRVAERGMRHAGGFEVGGVAPGARHLLPTVGADERLRCRGADRHQMPSVPVAHIMVGARGSRQTHASDRAAVDVISITAGPRRPDARVGRVPDLESVLAGLNDSQREAALALRGPVAIVAGAGTGKTTTITHRIACQVRSGAFDASQILAVTFTDKAAGELKRRLEALEVDGVEARTFHSAALSQLSRLWSAHTGDPLPDVLDAKAPLIASLANALPPPHKFLPRRELASEIEWAKNRMIEPARYLEELGDHEPPIPAELMLRIYDGYERRKRAMGRLDFEDMLGLALRLFDDHPDAADAVRSRFSAFTVDEFQDVNPLQAGLLDRWLGERDDLCVVGDDYQTIYAFTGASPEHLLDFTRRFPHATVVRLEENYRSSPEILELANRLVPSLGGIRKTLRPNRPSGPSPVARAEPDEGAEVAAVVQAVQRLHVEEAVPLEEIAVLSRINARSEPFEEAFVAAGIPYQVRDGAFLRRPGPRGVVQRLQRASAAHPVAEAVAGITDSSGTTPTPHPTPTRR